MVSRNLTPEMKAALAKHIIRPVTFVEVDWPDDPVYAHSNIGEITWGGHKWQGVGNFGSVTFPSAARSIVAQQASLLLSVPEADVTDVIDAHVRNRMCKIHWGLLDLDTEQLIPTPQAEFIGRVDATKFSVQAQDGSVTTVIQLDLVSGIPARRRAAVTHSFEDQITNHSGDTAGRHLWNITTKKLHWGG